MGNPLAKRQSSALVVLAVGVSLASYTARNSPTGTIEKKYYAAGPWAVTVNLGAACCDSLHNKFDLYYPTNLGANGVMPPVLTWGNGSFGKSSDCAYLLTHMASWGFVVIATSDQFTGPGQTIIDAANYLVHANSDAPSIFLPKLNVAQHGAFGTAQGAGGAINALVKSAGSIKTVIPIELPAHMWCTLGPSCPDTSSVTSGSIFFIDGSSDILISPPTQSQPLGE